MSRSGLLNLTLLVLVIMAAVAGALLWQVNVMKTQQGSLEVSLNNLRNELNNLAALQANQEQLDNLTLDERASTLLDVLKYLGLETMNLNFQIVGRESQSAGDTTLITRTATINHELPYAEALELLDQLYGNGKFQLRSVALLPGPPEQPQQVAMTLQGVLYSLEKRGEVVR